jgi:NADH-quinone oxidoreductase subunit K
MITPVHYVLLSVILFTIGLVILVARRERYVLVVGTQLLFQAALLALAALTHWFQDWNGAVAALVVIALGAVTGGIIIAAGPGIWDGSEQDLNLTAHQPGPLGTPHGPGEDRNYL